MKKKDYRLPETLITDLQMISSTEKIEESTIVRAILTDYVKLYFANNTQNENTLKRRT